MPSSQRPLSCNDFGPCRGGPEPRWSVDICRGVWHEALDEHGGGNSRRSSAWIGRTGNRGGSGHRRASGAGNAVCPGSVGARAGPRPLGWSRLGAPAGSVLRLRLRGIQRSPAVPLGTARVPATLRIGAALDESAKGRPRSRHFRKGTDDRHLRWAGQLKVATDALADSWHDAVGTACPLAIRAELPAGRGFRCLR